MPKRAPTSSSSTTSPPRPTAASSTRAGSGRVAEAIDIPFCVAGGIRTVEDAGRLLAYGADKISVNSPALADPDLISRLADRFGVQCVVVGIDSVMRKVRTNTASTSSRATKRRRASRSGAPSTGSREVQKRGAGEIVLNMMNQDGVRRGYDLRQLAAVRSVCRVPLIASGGAGEPVHFLEAFRDAKVDGALAASVFHKKIINIGDLKNYLRENNIEVRTC
ncbi:MAG: imidazole glycerol phosphate synthase subunit HisF [Sutterella wadsworthensis]